MKKIAFILSVLFAIVAGGVIFLPQLVPMESIAAKVREQVKIATGRDMDFIGATLMFWPNIGVEMTGVTLSNPPWAKEKNMLALGRLDIALALQPLLQRRIEVKRFVLDAPVIHLEIAENGKKSWDFTKEKPALAEQEEGGEAAAGMTKGFDFKFGPSKVNNGKLTLTNRQNGSSSTLGDIDITVTLPDLKSSLQLQGALTYRKKRVDLLLDLVKPGDFAEGNASPGRMNLKTDDLSVKAAGVLATQGELFSGAVEADVASLAKLLAWVGGGQKRKLPFEKISFNSALRASKTDITLKKAELTFDEIRARGNLNVGFAGKPDIFARLSVNKLNLNRFTEGKEEPGSGAGPAEDRPQEGWDAAPIDLSGLKSVNADLELKTEGFTVNAVEVGPGLLTVQLQDGHLHFKSSEASLFEGKFSSDLTINAKAAPATMSFAFNMNGVQARPVLTNFAKFKKLSGTADAAVSVTSIGNSQKSLISNLNGHGSVVFKKGALEGIDLVNIAQLVQKRLADINVGAGKTDFVELGGAFTVHQGIADNADLKMKGPLLQASGKGSIDLPRKYIRYRVIPVLTASSAVESASGLAVPVDIQGPFSNIQVKPDFAAALQGVIQHPEDAKQVLKNAREQIKTLKKDPLQTLQNLLGGGGLFDKPAPAPPAAPEASPVP